MHDEIERAKAEEEKFKRDELEEKQKLEAENKAKLIQDKIDEQNLYIEDDEVIEAPTYDEDHLPTPGLNM